MGMYVLWGMCCAKLPYEDLQEPEFPSFSQEEIEDIHVEEEQQPIGDAVMIKEKHGHSFSQAMTHQNVSEQVEDNLKTESLVPNTGTPLLVENEEPESNSNNGSRCFSGDGWTKTTYKYEQAWHNLPYATRLIFNLILTVLKTLGPFVIVFMAMKLGYMDPIGLDSYKLILLFIVLVLINFVSIQIKARSHKKEAISIQISATFSLFKSFCQHHH